MEIALFVVVVVIALAFDYTNGFHDAANAIATSVSTRALTPRVALALLTCRPPSGPSRPGRLTSTRQPHYEERPRGVASRVA